MKVSISSVHSIKKAYLECKRKADCSDISSFPVKKRGRPLLLGDCLDIMVQKYLKKVRGGGVVTAHAAIAAACAIVLTQD